MHPHAHRSRRGQSLVEVLVGMAIGAIFIVGAAAVIAPTLQITKQTTQIQTKTELANEDVSNIRAWAEGNWNNILALATGTANPYYLNTANSPFSIPLSGGSPGSPLTITLDKAGPSSTAAGGTKLDLTHTVTNGAQSAVVVAILGTQGATTTSVTYNGNAMTQICQVTDTVLHQYYTSIWIAAVGTGDGTSHNATATFSSAPSVEGMTLISWSGVDQNSIFRTPVTSHFDVAGGGPTTLNVANAQANDVVIDGIFAGQSRVPTSTQTIRDGLKNVGANGVSIGTASANAAGATTMGYTLQSTETIGTFCAAALIPGIGGATSGQPATGTEALTVSSAQYQRYFYLSDVYRDANGNVTSTVSGNSYYDPSTKLVTVVVGTSGTSPTPTTTLSFYLTRNAGNNFTQTSWGGSSGQNNPVTLVSSDYYQSSNVTINASGTIQLTSGGNSCTL